MLFRKLLIIWNICVGYLIKWKIDICGCGNLQVLSDNKSGSTPSLIVSLTSYGRRVSSEIVYYTLISLLKQTKKPDRIVLWLAYEEWSDNTLPHRLKSLRKYGIDFKYCEDMRSYKKLIPALREYPDDIIITVDDDLYYSEYLLETLYDGYLKDPSKIYCLKASEPSFDDRGNVKTYNQWNECPSVDSYFLFPIGCSGILYPPRSLYSDVCNESIFMNLCPLADDLWFWLMALKNGTKRYQLKNRRCTNYSFDNLYQFFHKGAALTHSNSKRNQNDVQLSKILNYYRINSKENLLSVGLEKNNKV